MSPGTPLLQPSETPGIQESSDSLEEVGAMGQSYEVLELRTCWAETGLFLGSFSSVTIVGICGKIVGFRYSGS